MNCFCATAAFLPAIAMPVICIDMGAFVSILRIFCKACCSTIWSEVDTQDGSHPVQEMCEMWWWCQTFSLTAFSGLWHWCFRGHWVVACREQWACCGSAVSKAERCSQHCAFGSRGAWPSGKQWTLLTCAEMCWIFLPGKGLNIQKIVIFFYSLSGKRLLDLQSTD